MGEGFNAHSLLQDLEKEAIRKQLVGGAPSSNYSQGLEFSVEQKMGWDQGMTSQEQEGFILILPLISLLCIYSSPIGDALNKIYHCPFS